MFSYPHLLLSNNINKNETKIGIVDIKVYLYVFHKTFMYKVN